MDVPGGASSSVHPAPRLGPRTSIPSMVVTTSPTCSLPAAGPAGSIAATLNVRTSDDMSSGLTAQVIPSDPRYASIVRNVGSSDVDVGDLGIVKLLIDRAKAGGGSRER